MKLTTRGRYGLRLMLELALHYNEDLVQLKNISHNQEISEKYLWHMILPLRNAGLVSSIRGSRGGYRLARPPSEITLKDIFLTIEGPINLVDCIPSETQCARSEHCAARDVWKEIGDKIQDVLQSVTLEQLVDRQKRKDGTQSNEGICI